MAEPLAYLNGEFLPSSRALLSPWDAGFVQGATVVDNCRTYNRRLFRWGDHLARFRRDCEACFIPLNVADADIATIANRLVAENCVLANDDLHLITFATPTSFGMQTRPLDRERHRQFQERGASLRIIGHQPVDDAAILSPRWKQRSRMVWHIAEHLAGADVAVLLDRPDGTLTETAIANILAVIDGILVTPLRNRILDGI